MKPLISISLFLLAFLGSSLVPFTTKPRPDITATPSSSNRTPAPRLSSGYRPNPGLVEIANLQDPDQRLQRLISLGSTIPVDQLKNWLTPSNLGSLDPALRSLFLTLTCDRWLEESPRDLIFWNAYAGLVDTHHYLARWLINDRDSATGYLLTKPTGFAPGYSLSQTIQRLAKLDFDLAFDVTKEQLTQSLTNDQYINPALLALAKQDLQSFISLGSSLPDKIQPKITPTIAASLFESNFQTALSHLAHEEDPVASLISSKQILGDPAFSEAVFDHLDQLPDGWLQAFLENTSLSRSSKSLQALELGPGQLGLSPETFGRLLVSQGGSKFGPENRPRVISLLNNPDLPFEARSTFMYAQWQTIPLDQLSSDLDQINDPALRSIFLKIRAPFE